MVDVEQEIIACVDKVLTDVLGEFAKRAILISIKEKGITLTDIISQPEKFMEGLRSVFGSGAGVLEKAFIFELGNHFKVDSLYNNTHLSFPELVGRIRNHPS